MRPALLLLASLALSPLAFAKPARKAPPPPAPPPVEAPAPPVDPLGPLPEVGPEVPFAVPVPETASLSNGASVWVLPKPGLPLVTVTLTVPGGSATDAPGREGTAWLADRMLTQGAGKLDAEGFAETVERLGIELDVSTGRAGSTITMSMKKEQLDEGLDLLADMVLRPRFKGKDLKRERKLAVQDLQLQLDDPSAVAARAAWAAWFGAEHPYGRPTDGTVDGMGDVSKKDAKAYWARAWNSAGARVTVTGDLGKDEAVKALEGRLGAAWKATTPARVTVPPAPAHTGEVLLVDRPDSAQTVFYLVFAGMPFGDPAIAPVRAGTIVLGGTFTSRLNALLREKRGYTYGVRAGVHALPDGGVLTVSSRIRTDASGPAMVDLVGELARIREGVTEDELRKARGAYRQDLVEAMETRAGAAATFAAWHFAGKGPDALGKELAAVQAVAPRDVPAAMAPYDPAKAVIVLVGDRKAIEGPLKEAGVEAIRTIEAR